MKIDLLFVEACPNHALARCNLDAALAKAGLIDIIVAERKVDTDDEARALGMHGSPTILVDGQDPFAGPGIEPSLSCRLYGSGDALIGAPSIDDLAAALGA